MSASLCSGIGGSLYSGMSGSLYSGIGGSLYPGIGGSLYPGILNQSDVSKIKIFSNDQFVCHHWRK